MILNNLRELENRWLDIVVCIRSIYKLLEETRSCIHLAMGQKERYLKHHTIGKKTMNTAVVPKGFHVWPIQTHPFFVQQISFCWRGGDSKVRTGQLWRWALLGWCQRILSFFGEKHRKLNAPVVERWRFFRPRCFLKEVDGKQRSLILFPASTCCDRHLGVSLDVKAAGSHASLVSSFSRVSHVCGLVAKERKIHTILYMNCMSQFLFWCLNETSDKQLYFLNVRVRFSKVAALRKLKRTYGRTIFDGLRSPAKQFGSLLRQSASGCFCLRSRSGMGLSYAIFFISK